MLLGPKYYKHKYKHVPWNFSSIQSLSRVWLFASPWTAARQASLSITNCQSLPKLMSIESVMPSNHLICRLLFLLPSIFASWVHAKLCPTLCNSMTVDSQAPLSMGFPKQEYRRLSWPGDQTCVSCIGRWIFIFIFLFFLPLSHLGSPTNSKRK